MIKVKMIIGMVAISVLAVGCHTSIPEGDETYCQDVADAQQAINDAPIESSYAQQELYDDIVEMGGDGHCPGYEVQADD